MVGRVTSNQIISRGAALVTVVIAMQKHRIIDQEEVHKLVGVSQTYEKWMMTFLMMMIKTVVTIIIKAQ